MIKPSHFLMPMLRAPWLKRDAETARAVSAALALIERDAWAEALPLIEYAQRRMPGDGTLTFALAEVSLMNGRARAADMFRFLVEKTGWGEALRRLAACCWQAGDRAGAVGALGRALSEHAPPQDREFAELAGEIAGDLGWCGLDNAGFVTISSGCELLLDGGKPAGKRVGKRGFQLEAGWHKAARLSVLREGRELVGSPIDVRKLSRVEGFVRLEAGGVAGWCWYPGEPLRVAEVSVGGVAIAADVPIAERDEDRPFAEIREFSLGAREISELGARIEVIGPHGRRLYGSPLWPRAEVAGAVAAARKVARCFPLQGDGETDGFVVIPADVRGAAPGHAMPDLEQRRVLVVIPVYLGLQETIQCLESVLAARSGIEDVLLVVDGSSDFELIARLRELAASGEFELDVQEVNRGFPGAANVGLRASAGRDVVLLNSDTLVPPEWLAGLQAAVYGANDVGTATPLSNAATIFSYPSVEKGNSISDLAEVCAAARLAGEVNGGVVVDVPTAHGFCMYIRAECLSDTGVFRDDLFAQGYGEENDFSLRASSLGWRHVAAAGCFVGHREGVSFGAARLDLVARNLEILERLHPGYERLVDDWIAVGPLFDARRRMDVRRFHQDQVNREAVLIITHDEGGGVERHVRERVREIDQRGMRAVVVRPGKKGAVVSAGDFVTYPNLVFGAEELVEFLRGCQIAWAEIHHTLGHDPAVVEALAAAFPVYDVILHDYAWYCPRITLTARDDRYCGEPDVAQCALCVADYGSELKENIGPAALYERSLKLLAAARAVVAPSADAAKRYAKRFGIKVRHEAWEDESGKLALRPILKLAGAERRVAVVGGISVHKGYDLLLQVARYVAARKLPLEFVVVGFTADDERLLATGVVRITGYYLDKEAEAVIAAQEADFAFFPSQWPETWSYVLSQVWRVGLPVIALDIGAPADRIRARSGGLVVPAHMPVERLVKMFMEPGLFKGQ
jgi:GT2 family glycosyltransferase/glycosyltransferase involved in cell wall biosynthesis